MFNGNLTKLAPDSIKFLEMLSQGTKAQSDVATLAIASALANRCNFPSGEVESATIHYKTLNAVNVTNELSKLDEMFIINSKKILKLAEDFFMVRYNAAHPAKAWYGIKASIAIPNFFGFGNYVNEEDLAVIQTNSLEISVIYNGVTALLDELTLTSQSTGGL